MAKGAELVIRISGNSKKFRKELDKVRKESRKTAESLTKAFGPKANRNVANLKNSVLKLSKAEQRAAKEADKAARAAKKAAEERERRTERRLRNIKRVAAALAVLAVAGLTASVIEFAKFEQGLAGVSKTTNIVGKELEGLGDEINDLSIKLGTSTGELLELAKSAGQLDVKGSKNILKFTEVMAGLAKTTNIAGEEGAIALARLIKVTDENIDNVDRLASVIVDLGNNTAALEDEILFTAQQIAGAGKVFGITATQALGLAAAFAQLAIPPELARGTILRAFGKIQEAISEAGSDMEKLILITGLTGEELKKTFEEDSVKVFGLFLKGVAKLPKSQLIPFLEDFKLAGLRLEATLPKLALGSDLVAEKVERAAIAFDKNTAASDELAIQTDTTLFRFQQLRAELALTRQEIGEELNPAIEDQIRFWKALAPIITNVVVPAVSSVLDLFTDLADFFDTVLIPITVKVFEKTDKMSESFRDAKTAIKEFLGLDLNEFEKLRKVIKEDIELGRITGDRAVPEAPEQTIFGEILDPEAAAKVQAINDEIAVQMAIARENEKNERLRVIEEIAAEKEEELERLATERAEKLVVDLQAITDKEERDEQAAKDKVKADKKAAADEIKAKEKAEKDLIKLKKNRVDEEKKLDKAISDSVFDTLSTIVGDNKAAQLAIFIVQKALALSRLAIITEEAALLAFGAQQILGDPTSFARGTAAAAAVRATGAAAAGIIIATAVPEIAGTFIKGQAGGTVPGGFGGGDRVPILLEPGELIVPQNLNPLSPNFDETFGGGLGNQEVTVRIDLSDEASQFITVGQREDSTLGVQR